MMGIKSCILCSLLRLQTKREYSLLDKRDGGLWWWWWWWWSWLPLWSKKILLSLLSPLSPQYFLCPLCPLSLLSPVSPVSPVFTAPPLGAPQYLLFPLFPLCPPVSLSTPSSLWSLLAPSGALVVIMVYYISAAATHFLFFKFFRF